MNASNNMSEICRTCLSQCKCMFSIKQMNIHEMILLCTDIKIDVMNELPNQICYACYNDLTISYKFRIKSEKCDKYLQKLINENGTVPDNIKIEKIEDVIECSQKRVDFIDEKVTEDVISEKQSDGSDAECPVLNNDSFADSEASEHTVDKSTEDNYEDSVCEVSVKCFTCKICQKSFVRKKDLSEHETEHKKKTYECDYCSKCFYKISTLKHHIFQNHKTVPHCCTKCPRQFTLRIELESHLKSHDCTCKTCGKTLKTRKNLKIHEKSHMEQIYLPCTKCGKFFKNNNSLKGHIRKHHIEGKKVCPNCGKEVQNLKDHITIMHSTERPFKCDQCNSAFAKESLLRQHFKIHTGKKYNRRELCTVCGKNVFNFTELRMHMRSHTGERPFKCSICNKTFIRKAGLLSHKNVHTKEKTHECPVCHKMFTTKACVKVHQRTHTGERPYRCKICDRAFGQGSTLRTHMKKHLNNVSN